jgi:DNA-binding transcriptional LysR family regulator
MTRELFNDLPHIDVHVVLGRPGTGHRLAERGWDRARVRRRVVLTVPYFMTAALAAAATDCVAGLPDRMAALCTRILPLKVVPATFPLPSMKTVMVWHERTDADPGARTLRAVVGEAVK